MTEELDILKIIANNPAISQRKIAEQTGISLGQVNFLIKKYVRKGLLKIEGQTTKSIKYNLTPKGLSEKAALTMEYIKISYIAVVGITNRIREIVEQYVTNDNELYVCGIEDEMMQIIRLVTGNVTSLEHDIHDGIIIYWDPGFFKQRTGGFNLYNCICINILE